MQLFKLQKHKILLQKLSWIDIFIENVKPFIFVRIEDNLLIKRPNNAQKLNPFGAKLLKALIDGETIETVLRKIEYNPEKANQINQFMMGVKLSLEGRTDAFSCNPAVEHKPFDMKFSDYPVLSELALTYRCNLKCSFCYAGCNYTSNPIGSDKEMTSKEVYSVIDMIYHQAKVPSISFTGGEPTLISELPKYIRHAKKTGMRVNLITNGTLIDRTLAKKLKASGLDSAQVSIEGTTANIHDNLTGIAGSYQKSMKAVAFLLEHEIRTHTNTTITSENLTDCINFPCFVAENLKTKRFSMNLLIPTGSGETNNKLIVPYSKIGQHLEKINNESKKHGVEFMWYSPVPMCMFNTITEGLGNKGCAACDGLISVAPNGDILPCASYDLPVGNLLNEGFKNVWYSTKAVWFRKKEFANEICKKCDDFHICNGACPLYWRSKGYTELEAVNPV